MDSGYLGTGYPLRLRVTFPDHLPGQGRPEGLKVRVKLVLKSVSVQDFINSFEKLGFNHPHYLIFNVDYNYVQ